MRRSGNNKESNEESTKLPFEKQLRRGMDDFLQTKILQYNYKFGVRKLNHNDRYQRIKLIALQVLAAAIDLNTFKDDGLSYMKENQECIATDIGFILSIITKMISKWMKFDVKAKYDTCIPPAPDQENNKEMQCTIPISLEASQTISKKLLIATTSTDYSNIVLTMNESMKCKQFPSYYLITKHYPELENGVVKILPKYEHLLSDKLRNARLVE